MSYLHSVLDIDGCVDGVFSEFSPRDLLWRGLGNRYDSIGTRLNFTARFCFLFSTISSFWKYICRCIPAYDSAKSIGRSYNLFYWGEPWQWILRIFAGFPRQIGNGSFYLTIDVACSETSWYFFRYVVVDNFLNSNLAYFKHIL